ncbi:MAG: beta-propeller fold lactonase family protein [Verrucomicrobia bacterium]|nr:beta-propeller fold lactonase family protein [Verrucomicrobiota bacterium]
MRPSFCGAVHPVAAQVAALLVALGSALSASAQDQNDNVTPAGQLLTPTAAPGSAFEYFNPELSKYPDFRPSGGAATVLSPDKKTMVIVISGYNLWYDPTGKQDPAASTEYIFVYDVSSGKPVKKQVIQIPNTFVGAAFDPSGNTLYVGGGKDDDVHIFTRSDDGTWSDTGTPVSLGHKGINGVTPSDAPPETAGLAVTPDGSRLVVCNLENDSVSIVDPHAGTVVGEVDLRPGKINPAQQGVPGGEYPYGVVIKGNDLAYVSSLRDREIVAVSLGTLGEQPAVVARINVKGSPNSLLLNRNQTRLFVTADMEDVVNVIDANTNSLLHTIRTTGPDYAVGNFQPYRGSIPNNLALSPDEKTLYVTNAGNNSLAVIDLSARRVTGLIPTSFWPTAVATSQDGNFLFVTNWKSPAGPNPEHFTNPINSNAANQYVLQLDKAGLLTIPLVTDPGTLDQLTRTVAANNGYSVQPDANDQTMMAGLRNRIKHVIYIVKENRTYDQLLGDLPEGNGDPFITQFGYDVTPNFHRLVTDFVLLDNFYTPGDVSGNGWPWSTAGRETDYGVKSITENYAGRGFSYDTEGTNRDVNVGYARLDRRLQAAPYLTNDPDILPGAVDVAAPDGPEGQKGKGYLWDAALRAGLAIRDYGFFCDLVRYGTTSGNTDISAYQIPLERNPASVNLQVAFPTKPALIRNFDPYFRSFDTAFPDFYREAEWEREFAAFDQNGNLPQLSFVRLMEDHMGNFNRALDMVNTPEKQQADNDYAVARLVDRVAHSSYKNDTLIFICEDDSQDGPDHVDAHRSTAYVVGPYVKHNALVSDRYSTVNLIRTIEDVLGLEHLNLYTATARPMTSCFDLNQQDWDFVAQPSAYLVFGTTLPVPQNPPVSVSGGISTHDAAYWAEKTKDFDFSREDNLFDPQLFNRIIWAGLKGTAPYPAARTGLDLRRNREKLLEQAAILFDLETHLPGLATQTQQSRR